MQSRECALSCIENSMLYRLDCTVMHCALNTSQQSRTECTELSAPVPPTETNEKTISREENARFSRAPLVTGCTHKQLIKDYLTLLAAGSRVQALSCTEQ